MKNTINGLERFLFLTAGMIFFCFSFNKFVSTNRLGPVEVFYLRRKLQVRWGVVSGNT